MEKNTPNITGSLRHRILRIPEAAYSASGIIINGRRIKSLAPGAEDKQ